MTKYQKDVVLYIYIKRGLFKDIKNDIPMSQIYDTQMQHQNAKKTQHMVYF